MLAWFPLYNIIYYILSNVYYIIIFYAAFKIIQYNYNIHSYIYNYTTNINNTFNKYLDIIWLEIEKSLE